MTEAGSRTRVNREFELALFAIVGAQAFEQERAKAGTSSATEGVEDEEALLHSDILAKFSPAYKPKRT